jgi:membrane protease YdiL (CAAX protease family)
MFFTIAFLFTWALLPAARSSIAISLVALCGPAVAACLTAWWSGSVALRELWHRATHWRVPALWYCVAVFAPLIVSMVAAGFEYVTGAAGPIGLQPISALQAVVFVLVAGEEIGWRGYALPRLLSRTSPLRASVFLGAMWALWHLPLFYMPQMPQYGHPFGAFVVYTIALSIVMTFLAQRTGCSVIIATLFHGAVNTFGVVNAAATPAQKGWANAAGYGLAAIIVATLAWSRRGAR